MQVNIHEAKTNLSKLILKVIQGEEVIISKAGNPIVKVVRIEHQKNKKRELNHAKNMVNIPKAFFDPLPDDILEGFNS